jgi:pilus assembly protein Flp/PilA
MSFVSKVDEVRDGHVPNFTRFIDGELTMNSMTSRIRLFLTDEDGPTAVEYAVMVGLIAVALVAIVTSLGLSISGTFSTVSSTLAS